VLAPNHLRHLDGSVLRGAAVWSFDNNQKLIEIDAGSKQNCILSSAYMNMMTQDERRRLIHRGTHSCEILRGLHIDRSAKEIREAFAQAFSAK
jgi:hypothetical protein